MHIHEQLNPVKNKTFALNNVAKIFDANANIVISRGFLFIKSKKFLGNDTIQHPGKYYKMDFINVMHELHQDLCSKDIIRASVAKSILIEEYKIHIRVKAEHVVFITNELLKYFSQHQQALTLINSLKVGVNNLFSKDIKNNYFPHIVIYPSLGKENAELLLNYVNDCMLKLNMDLAELSDNLTPRFSYKINPILSYAQYSGDFKLTLTEEQTKDLFTEDMTHFKSNTDEYKLQIINNFTPQKHTDQTEQIHLDADKEKFIPTAEIDAKKISRKNSQFNLKQSIVKTDNNLIFSLNSGKKRLLGKGGQARVKTAIDLNNSQKVAVKISATNNTTYLNSKELWLNERNIMSELNRNKGSFFDRESQKGYIFQDIITGYTLGNNIFADINYTLPVSSIFTKLETITYALLTAVNELHSKNIIHRDIKPEHVIQDESGKKCTLIDFGVSIKTNASIVTKDFVGTDGYIAPEIKSHKRYGKHSDIYACGMTIQKGLFEKCKEFIFMICDVKSCAPAIKYLNDFENLLINRMLDSNIENRPSINRCIEILHKLSMPAPVLSQIDNISSNFAAILLLEDQDLQSLFQDLTSNTWSICNTHNLDLLQLATMHNKSKMVNSILNMQSINHVAKTINNNESNYINPLFIALINSNITIAKNILNSVPTFSKQQYINTTYQNTYNTLHLAVEFGLKEIVLLLLDNQADINLRIAGKAAGAGGTPLYTAIQHKHLDIANILIDHKADVDLGLNSGFSPIQKALAMGLDDLAVNIYHRSSKLWDDNKKYSILNLAINNHCEKFVNIFCKDQKEILKQSNNDGHNFIHLAVLSKANINIIQAILDNITRSELSHYINATDNQGFSALHIAAEFGLNETVLLLLDNQADINLRIAGEDTGSGGTPLYTAIQYKHLDIANILIDHNTDVDLGLNSGFSPIQKALEMGLDDLAVNIYHRSSKLWDNNKGYSILNLAVNNHCEKFVNIFCKNQKEILKQSNNDGYNFIHLAVLSKANINIIQAILDNITRSELSRYINATNNKGFSALHIAAEFGLNETVLLLVKYQADINLRIAGEAAGAGGTPLYTAIQHKHLDIANILIDHKADVDLGLNSGFSPIQKALAIGLDDLAVNIYHRSSKLWNDNKKCYILDLAVNNHCAKFVNIFCKDQKEILKQSDNDGCNFIHLAVLSKANINIIQAILDNITRSELSRYINATNNKGSSALHIAAEFGLKETVLLLLDNQADINLRIAGEAAGAGGTPLYTAIQHKHLDIANILIDHKANVDLGLNSGLSPIQTALAMGLDDLAVNIYNKSDRQWNADIQDHIKILASCYNCTKLLSILEFFPNLSICI